MQEVDTLSDTSIYLKLRNILRIARQAAHAAQLENERYGIPKIFSRKGIMYYEYPDGRITTERPEMFERGEE